MTNSEIHVHSIPVENADAAADVMNRLTAAIEAHKREHRRSELRERLVLHLLAREAHRSESFGELDAAAIVDVAKQLETFILES